MNKVMDFLKDIWACCCNGLMLFVKNQKQVTAEELVRKMLYSRFGIVLMVAIFSSLAACILLHMPAMLLIVLISIVVYLSYTGYIEYLAAHNELFYVKVVCVNSKKEWKVSVKPVYTYYFQGIGNDANISFSLNRTEELGFAQNVCYLFCFRRSADNQIDNSNLIHYMELNQLDIDTETSPSASINDARKEALKKVKAARHVTKAIPAADFTGENEKTNLVKVNFSASADSEEE